MEQGTDIKYGNILIIGNREPLLQLLKGLLEEDGYKHRIERQIDRGVSALGEIPFDLVIITETQISECIDRLNGIQIERPASERFSIIVLNDREQPRSGLLFTPRFEGLIDHVAETSQEELMGFVEQHLYTSMSRRMRAAEAARPREVRPVADNNTPRALGTDVRPSSPDFDTWNLVQERLAHVEQRLARMEMVLAAMHESLSGLRSLLERSRPARSELSPN